MSQLRYFVKRTVQTVVLLFLVLTFLFFMFRLLPGDYTDLMLAQGVAPERAAAFRERWGLDEPLYVQYVRYILNFLQGDVGTSLATRQPVLEYVQMRIFHSFILIAPAITFSYLVGSLFGIVTGMNRGSPLEQYGILPLIFLGSLPAFVTSIYLIFIFAGHLDWFPTSSMVSYDTQVTYRDAPWWRQYLTVDFAQHYVLPFTAVVFRYLYLPALIMRTSIIEVMGQGFTLYNRVKGLPQLTQMKHLGKHAMLPVVTLYPVSMTRAIGGLVLIEMVFDWPGIGYLLIQSVFQRDYPTVQFVFFLIAAFVVIANFVVDLFYSFIDPRITVGD